MVLDSINIYHPKVIDTSGDIIGSIFHAGFSV